MCLPDDTYIYTEVENMSRFLLCKHVLYILLRPYNKKNRD